jgi:hypothetical protein
MRRDSLDVLLDAPLERKAPRRSDETVVPARSGSAGAHQARPSALPLGLLSCLPLLWTRVLFPGWSRPASHWSWRRFLLVLLLPGLFLYPRMAFPLFEPDEGRYAQIPFEMLSRGEGTIPYLQGEPYLDKPPLLYWLVMLSYAVLGTHDWAARLVPALAVHATVLLTYLLGRRRVGDRAAFWGAVVLALAPGFIGMGRLVLHDGLLALWVTLALFAAMEALRAFGRKGDSSPEERGQSPFRPVRWGWWLTAATACGLGVLTKGPVILLLVGPPLWLHRRLTGRGAALRWPHLLAFAGLTLAVALPWYAAVCLRRPEFVRHFLWEHNVLRFLRPFDHLEPVWYFLPILVLGLLPASLLLPPLARFLLSGDAMAARRRSPELGLLLLAGLWCVLFFSLSGSKLPTYILPAFPPLALALGTFLSVSRWRRSRWTWAAAVLAVLLGLVGHNVVVPQAAWERSALSRADEVRRCCGERSVPVVCIPRSQDSVAFYVGRDDFRSYRSKDTEQLLHFLGQQPRTVVLFTHQYPPEHLRRLLPPGLRLSPPLHAGDCELAIVQRQPTR